jgi:putative salt-induced outer membrane protein YdiY
MRKSLGLLTLVLAPLTAFADDEPPRLWEGEANLAYIERSGNTNSTNVDFRSNATRNGEQWRNIYKLEGANEYSEEERSAENYFASAKAEYNLDEVSYLFGLLEYTNDNFSGFEYEASAVFGYGRNLIENDKHELSADIGVGYRNTEIEDTTIVEEEAVIRVGALYSWKISESATFDEEFSSEFGDEKTVTKSYTRLKLKINGHLYASLAYEIEHTSEVPPDKKNSDRKTLVGFNYTF